MEVQTVSTASRKYASQSMLIAGKVLCKRKIYILSTSRLPRAKSLCAQHVRRIYEAKNLGWNYAPDVLRSLNNTSCESCSNSHRHGR